MEKAGHTCIGHCEIDKYADASYRMMHTVTEEQREYLMTLPLKERQKEIRKEKYLNGEWYADDIRSVEPGDLPEADCYCFGFPCQSFSLAGHRLGFEDTRGTLFFEVMRLAKERHPKVLFAENVKGLLSHDGGRTFGTIIRTMDELGYDVEWQICNSKYFGVPQNRERVLIVGHIRGERTGKVFPIGAYGEPPVELQGSIGAASDSAPHGMKAGFKSKPRNTDIASTVHARDYKGVCNQEMTVVYETDSDNSGEVK